MTKEQLFVLHKFVCQEALELMQKKNADYSKVGALDNFYVAEALKAASAEHGIIIRMGDKLSRLSSIISKGAQVKTESMQDTIIDLVNYSILLLAVIQEKANKDNAAMPDVDVERRLEHHSV